MQDWFFTQSRFWFSKNQSFFLDQISCLIPTEFILQQKNKMGFDSLRILTFFPTKLGFDSLRILSFFSTKWGFDSLRIPSFIPTKWAFESLRFLPSSPNGFWLTQDSFLIQWVLINSGFFLLHQINGFDFFSQIFFVFCFLFLVIVAGIAERIFCLKKEKLHRSLKKTMLLTLRWSSYFSGWWSENVKKTCKSSKNTHTIPTSFCFYF